MSVSKERGGEGIARTEQNFACDKAIRRFVRFGLDEGKKGPDCLSQCFTRRVLPIADEGSQHTVITTLQGKNVPFFLSSGSDRDLQ